MDPRNPLTGPTSYPQQTASHPLRPFPWSRYWCSWQYLQQSSSPSIWTAVPPRHGVPWSVVVSSSPNHPRTCHTENSVQAKYQKLVIAIAVITTMSTMLVIIILLGPRLLESVAIFVFDRFTATFNAAAEISFHLIRC